MVRYPVDVVVERVPLANRWLDPQWRTAAVFPVSRHDESTVDHWVATCERAGENAPPAGADIAGAAGDDRETREQAAGVAAPPPSSEIGAAAGAATHRDEGNDGSANG